MTKPAIQLDKPPMNLQDKETKLDRITRCERLLAEELDTNGNTLYAQDLEETIKTLER